MKINGYDIIPFSNMPSAETEAVHNTASSVPEDADMRSRMDTVEIKAGAPSSASFLGSLKASVLSAVNSDTPAQKLEALKESVGAGRYSVSSEELARILAR